MNATDDIEQALQQLKERFIDGLNDRVDVIASHLKPHSVDDIDQMRIAVHSLKGTSGTYGLMDISQHSLLLESVIKNFNDARLSEEDFQLQASQLIDQLRKLVSEIQAGQGLSSC